MTVESYYYALTHKVMKQLSKEPINHQIEVLANAIIYILQSECKTNKDGYAVYVINELTYHILQGGV